MSVTNRSTERQAARVHRPRWRAEVEPLEDRRLLALAVATIMPTEGKPFSGPVALFAASDVSGSVPLQATINWGGGTTPLASGLITQDANGAYVVSGSNTYTEAGTYTVTVQVAGINPPASQTGTAVVQDAPFSSAAGIPVSAARQVEFSGPVASFTDSNPFAAPGDFAATIDWGDGTHTASSGLVVQTGANRFTVQGMNTYAQPGVFPVTVTIKDKGGQTAVASTTATVTAQPLQAFGSTVQTGVNVPITNATVATFLDPVAADVPADFQASVNWADGQTTAGTVVSTSPGVYSVTGSHLYSATGAAASFPLTVTIADVWGQTAVAHGTALVVNPGAVPVVGFSGGLDPSSDHSPGHSGGDTNNTEPVFSGTAPPFALVDLFARRSDVDATLPIGQALASSGGQWFLTSSPLTPGVYTVTAVVTPPGASPSVPILVANNGLVKIDLTPPVVVGVQAVRGAGGYVVTFRDDLSGMNDQALLNPANYTFGGRGGAVAHPAGVSLLPSGGLPTDPQSVLLTLAYAPKINRLLRALRITGAGVVDNAGNSLQNDYHGDLPSANFRAVGNTVVPIKTRAPHALRRARR